MTYLKQLFQHDIVILVTNTAKCHILKTLTLLGFFFHFITYKRRKAISIFFSFWRKLKRRTKIFFSSFQNVMIICRNNNSVWIVCLDYRPWLKKSLKYIVCVQCDRSLTIDTNHSNPVLKDTTLATRIENGFYYLEWCS